MSDLDSIIESLIIECNINYSYNEISIIVDSKIQEKLPIYTYREFTFGFNNSNELVSILDRIKNETKIIFLITSKIYEDKRLFNLLNYLESGKSKIIYWNIHEKILNNSKLFNAYVHKMILIDYEKIRQLNNNLESILSLTNEYVLETENSQLYMSLNSKMIKEDCNFETSNVFQLPGGEVFYPLMDKTVNGQVTYTEFKNSVILEIKNNVIVNSNKPSMVNKILCEFGLGTNPFIPHTNLLDCFEKKYGTCHLGFGNNIPFGGDICRDYHFDIVIDNFKLFHRDGKGVLVTVFENRKI